MEKNLYANHPVRCIITGPCECGKSIFVPNLILNFINENDKINIYSPSLRQDLYRNSKKCFGNYIRINIIQNNLNEEDIDILFAEVIKIKNLKILILKKTRMNQ